MELIKLSPRNALNKAYLKIKAHRTEIELFKSNLTSLLDNINESESEEFHKNLISKFLTDTYYGSSFFINTKGRNDLVIHNTNSASGTVGVIVEAKSPINKAEMLKTDNINNKAFQELVLYFLRERITAKNHEIKHLVVTNIYEWFIFDANVFEEVFAKNKTFVNKFIDFEEKRLSGKKTDFFYKDIAQPEIEKIKNKITFTHFDLRTYDKILRNKDKNDDTSLIALNKLLSPEHLLKLQFANDSNSLDKSFYSELLHIIGLTEVKDGSKKLIQRKKDGEQNSGSLLENTIIQLESHDKISRVPNLSQFGETYNDQLFNIALELVITWMNRILFLKLLEAQLLSYHKGDKRYNFLNSDKIRDFDDLDKLFFRVLAKQVNERDASVNKLFELVPYLNSSLFEPTELEHQTIFINGLEDFVEMPILSTTVIKDNVGKKLTGNLPTLQYLFSFLDAYDFSSEGKEEIQEDNKRLINASVLGLIFEKINGYKDGSFFTPGFITMYMCRETIRRAVVQKFNEMGKNLPRFQPMADLNDISEAIGRKVFSRKQANELINSLKICDPAVGSGHFLVSALNEVIAIKSELQILEDKNGSLLNRYEIQVENDELIVTDEDGKLFEYNPKLKESQRIQETLFHEKQTIIENCLFGVDLNPNSVKICSLRLWIELLKNAYYKSPDYTELETLPNIDINIKCGNSLISRFALDADIKHIAKSSKWNIFTYQNAVESYRKSSDKTVKRELEKLIQSIKTNYVQTIQQKNPKLQKYYKLKQEYDYKFPENGLFANEPEVDYGGNIERREKEKQRLATEIEKVLDEIESEKTFFETHNAFEWRFEFPEVLNDEGDFVGFDVVIGNPPYIKEYEQKSAFDGLRKLECYQGKMDIWYMFGDLGLHLLKPNSYLAFIATNNWITNAGASNFRNIIINNSQIINLTDFGAYMVFENASIQTMIMLFKNTKLADNYTFDYRKLENDKLELQDALDLLNNTITQNTVLLHPTVTKANLIDKTFTFNTDTTTDLLNKIKAKHNFFLREKADNNLGIKSEIANGIHHHHDIVNRDRKEILQNLFEVGTGIFVLSKEEVDKLKLSKSEKELIKPQFSSKQVLRYYTNPKNEDWVIYTRSDINKPDKNTKKIPIDNFPKIKEHLNKFKSVITSDFGPYGLHRAREQYFFEGEKIAVLRKCSKEPLFSYSDFNCYLPAAFYIIKSDRINLKYLTGLLNSKLVAFWLRKKGKMQGNNYQLDKEPLLEIPILKPSEKESNQIAKLVDTIISLKQQSKDSNKEEKKIDQLVYQLYGLTKEEIKIVEGN